VTLDRRDTGETASGMELQAQRIRCRAPVEASTHPGGNRADARTFARDRQPGFRGFQEAASYPAEWRYACDPDRVALKSLIDRRRAEAGHAHRLRPS